MSRRGLHGAHLAAIVAAAMVAVALGCAPRVATGQASAAAGNGRFGVRFLSEEEYRGVVHARAGVGDAASGGSVRLSHLFPPAGDQGDQSSCVGWATAYGFQSYWLARSREQSVPTRFSPSYVYNQVAIPAMCMESGAFIGEALDLLHRQGGLPLESFPYRDRACVVRPTEGQVREAAQYRIGASMPIEPGSLDQLRTHLTAGRPVVAGVDVPSSMQHFRGVGVYQLSPEDRNLGGHAVVVTGFDDARRAVEIYNSWGSTWGVDGVAWVAYDTYLRIAREAYVAPLDGREREVEVEPRDSTRVHLDPSVATNVSFGRHPESPAVRVIAAGRVVADADVTVQLAAFFYEADGAPIPATTNSFYRYRNQVATASYPLRLASGDAVRLDDDRLDLDIAMAVFSDALLARSATVGVQVVVFVDGRQWRSFPTVAVPRDRFRHR